MNAVDFRYIVNLAKTELAIAGICCTRVVLVTGPV